MPPCPVLRSSRSRCWTTDNITINKPGDGTYSAVIAGAPGRCEVRYYVEARADASLGTTAFMPAEAEMGAYRYQVVAPSESESAVVINEFMATNKRTVQDPQGQYDDWLEMYNRSDRSVDVSGMYLSDSETELLKWSFPPGYGIPAHGTLVVWLDDDLRGHPRTAREFQALQEGRDGLPDRLRLARQRDSGPDHVRSAEGGGFLRALPRRSRELGSRWSPRRTVRIARKSD